MVVFAIFGKFAEVERDIPQIWDRLIDDLETLNTHGLLPDLDSLSAFQKDDITEEKAE